MSKTKTIVLTGVLVVILMLAIGVKFLFFPSIKDIYFATSRRSLLKVPSGLIVIRPTHFPLHREAIIYAPSGKDPSNNWRMSGRNVQLRNLIAIAYDETRGRVVLPDDAPTNVCFDFVITAPQTRPSLQKAIRKTLHYTADKETNDTDVLAIKIVDPTLPGMTLSTTDKRSDTTNKNGKLTLGHTRLKELAPDFEWILKTPVVDETGLTNYYDMTFDWNPSMESRLQNETTARPIADKILKNLGLALEPDTAPVEVLMVKRVY
jgi:uncharacterized protein (TIGR03435 family)